MTTASLTWPDLASRAMKEGRTRWSRRRGERCLFLSGKSPQPEQQNPPLDTPVISYFGPVSPAKISNNIKSTHLVLSSMSICKSHHRRILDMHIVELDAWTHSTPRYKNLRRGACMENEVNPYRRDLDSGTKVFSGTRTRSQALEQPCISLIQYG